MGSMSAETKVALDAAIAAHVADECEGGTITGYVIQAQYQDVEMMTDNLTGYIRVIADGQGFTTTLGLAHHLALRLNASALDDD